ncbi:FadR/GntR family transcriptional regulator [Sporosarcina limicola]|uniref:DNA-binding transcriptional regulator YhcF (GntR family) n=1 Tax=Sporosarcina limicola TaxID=34101 RepID=A0A927RE97_9BACL|nr:GntR family transcriptional regulator [Sporosarcina limicola]MBE1554402.1 DNA-binding transcriptional regulator YhcF (GntR family) [Sporosarcina limicola]
MQKPKPPSKMFLDIVGELKSIIKEEGIITGGKLPSERELAERLQAGRSTIREALRSLELLGLIETRRGEGTFLADFKKHQLVEVLAAFIMQQPDSISDVQKTRRIHEKAAIVSVCKDSALHTLPVWESLLAKIELDGEILREDVIREMIVATGNRLSLKIWFLLKQYSKVPFDKMTGVSEKDIVKSLLENLHQGTEEKTLEAYSEWIELVEGERGEKEE